MLDVRSTMRRAARQNAWRRAVVAGDRSLTFAEAWERGLRLANALLAAGVRPGDRVGVLEDNRLESSDFFIASTVGGFVRVPLYRRNGTEAHRHMLGSTTARAVVVDEAYVDELGDLVAELPDLEHVIIRDGGYEEFLAAHPADDPDPELSLDDPYIIRFSAGTTGLPKGVTYSHRAWMSSMRDWFYGLPPVTPGDTCLHIGPISHGSGYLFTPVWIAGGSNILEPSFDPVETVEVMQRHRVAYMFMVPTMVSAMLGVPGIEEADWSFFKVGMISAAPISPKTALRARAVFGMTLYQMYGQTEAVPAAFMGPDEWFGEVEGSEPLVASGREMPFAQIEIRGPDNETLAVGEEGEIAVRNEGQMVSLWGDPDGTADRIIDGWVLTGDIGRLDENGYLYLSDRKDDLIISGGFNIWPLELERAIAEDPRIREVVVFGVPDDKWGETPLALCVVSEDCDMTAADVIALCADRLGSYKKPGRVVFQHEPVPKSPVGKIQRKVLREPYWEGIDRRVGGT
jgi:acyl-CoA synthetase (AMP-forming)/AMP-acid ligase II